MATNPFYCVNRQVGTFQEHIGWAAAASGVLATVGTSTLNTMLRTASAGVHNRDYWIGLRSAIPAPNPVTFTTWQDGTAFVDPGLWQGGQPNQNGEANGACARVNSATGNWFDDPCNFENRAGVYQFTTPSNCAGAINLGFVCFDNVGGALTAATDSTNCDPANPNLSVDTNLLYCLNDHIGNFAYHETAANSLGGNLASVPDSFVSATLGNQAATSDRSNVWIGGRDTDTDLLFDWVDGRTFVYNNWESGQPNVNTADSCILIPSGASTIWRDANCATQTTLSGIFQISNAAASCTQSKLFGFACVDYLGNTPTLAACPDPTETADTTVVHCMNPNVAAFAAHQTTATGLGGNLMNVENIFLQTIAGNLAGTSSPYIGLTERTENFFQWVGSDNDVVYSNWETNQPNVAGNGNCVVVDGSTTNDRWFDLDCTQTQPALYTLPSAQCDAALAAGLTCRATNGAIVTPGSTCPAIVAAATGDPHFLRWGKVHHDSFHGECDLVLLSNTKSYIDIHLRTKIRKFYSYIRKAAIRIGSVLIEIDQEHVTIDGSHRLTVDNSTSFPIAVSSRPHQEQDREDHVKIHMVNEKEFSIVWGTKSSIAVAITGIFLNLSVQARSDDFVDSTGLMGMYPNGEMLDRQGKLMDPSNMNAYGMEWQVKHDHGDPQLFSNAEGPQWPNDQCVLPHWVDPKKKQRRNLRRRLRHAARMACSGVVDVDLCVKDVLMTGELELAKGYRVEKETLFVAEKSLDT